MYYTVELFYCQLQLICHQVNLNINAFVRDANSHWASIATIGTDSANVSQVIDCSAQGLTVAYCGSFCKQIVYGSVHAKPVDNIANFGAVAKTCYVSHLDSQLSYNTSIIAKWELWVNQAKSVYFLSRM
jgi:hypothetical protein